MRVPKFIQFGITFTICLLTTISCNEMRKDNETPQDNKYHDMFIAHGGGAVEGYTKTNSLEGLNRAYMNGFRMFELDLQLTNDNKIVAVHDPIDMSEAEFLSQPIHEKLTPMNMEMINNWFENHPDAIFVTDKINRPDLLAEQFKFKDRLIMELFSWEAIEEAIELGVTPMLSQINFWGTPNIEKIIDSLNIKIVGMHRDAIRNDTELLKRIKEKGIKTYVWFTKRSIDVENRKHIFGKTTWIIATVCTPMI